MSDQFGNAVSISGSTAMIGASGTYTDAGGASSGVLYVFQESSEGVWSQKTRFEASAPTAGMQGDEFGFTVSLSGTTAVIGTRKAGAAYMREADCEAPTFLNCPDSLPVLCAVDTALTLDLTAVDNMDPAPVMDCVPSLDSVFSVGTRTEVVCTATDRSDNSATCSFNVSDYCLHDGMCSTSGDDFQCDCSPEWQGDQCEYEDDCLENPCLNGGLCDSVMGQSTCNCTHTGYTGVDCEISLCASQPCLHDCPCTIISASDEYECDCNGSGYIGQNCDTPVCLSSPCENGGNCSFSGSGEEFVCDCINTTYIGATCNEACENGGWNSDGSATQCTCPSQYYTPTCSREYGAVCDSSPCNSTAEEMCVVSHSDPDVFLCFTLSPADQNAMTVTPLVVPVDGNVTVSFAMHEGSFESAPLKVFTISSNGANAANIFYPLPTDPQLNATTEGINVVLFPGVNNYWTTDDYQVAHVVLPSDTNDGTLVSCQKATCTYGLLYTSTCAKEDEYWEAETQLCTKCPQHATCPGYNLIIPDPGYYRNPPEDETSDKIVRCAYPAEERCLGGALSECGVQYTGKFCAQCAANYYETTRQYCENCDVNLLAFYTQIGYTCLFFMALGVSIMYLSNRLLSIATTILIGVQQTIHIGYSYDFEPSEQWLADLFDAVKFVNLNFSELRQECIFPGLTVPSVAFITSCSFYVTLALASIPCAWYYQYRRELKLCIKQDVPLPPWSWLRKPQKPRVLRGVLVIFHICYSQLCVQTLNMLWCVVLDDGTSALFDDFSEVCYGTPITVATQIGAWFILVLGCVGVPIAVVRVMQKEYISSGPAAFTSVKSAFYYKYGFLYDNFLPSKFWFLPVTIYLSNFFFAFLNVALHVASYDSRFAKAEQLFSIVFPAVYNSAWIAAWIYFWPAANMEPLIARKPPGKDGKKSYCCTFNFGSGYVSLAIIYFQLALIAFTAFSSERNITGLTVTICLMITFLLYLTYYFRIVKRRRRLENVEMNDYQYAALNDSSEGEQKPK